MQQFEEHVLSLLESSSSPGVMKEGLSYPSTCFLTMFSFLNSLFSKSYTTLLGILPDLGQDLKIKL